MNSQKDLSSIFIPKLKPKSHLLKNSTSQKHFLVSRAIKNVKDKLVGLRKINRNSTVFNLLHSNKFAINLSSLGINLPKPKLVGSKTTRHQSKPMKKPSFQSYDPYDLICISQRIPLKVCFNDFEKRIIKDTHEEKADDAIKSTEHMKSLHENLMKHRKSLYASTKTKDLHEHVRQQLRQGTAPKLLESSNSAKNISQGSSKTQIFRRSIYIDKHVECNDSFKSSVSTPLYEQTPRYN